MKTSYIIIKKKKTAVKRRNFTKTTKTIEQIKSQTKRLDPQKKIRSEQAKSGHGQMTGNEWRGDALESPR